MSPITEHYCYRCRPNCPVPNTNYPEKNAVDCFSFADSDSPEKSYKILLIRSETFFNPRMKGFTRLMIERTYIKIKDDSFTNPQIVALKKAHNCLLKSMQQLKISGKG